MLSGAWQASPLAHAGVSEADKRRYGTHAPGDCGQAVLKGCPSPVTSTPPEMVTEIITIVKERLGVTEAVVARSGQCRFTQLLRKSEQLVKRSTAPSFLALLKFDKY